MSFITLFTGDNAWLATDRKVFSSEEFQRLETVLEQIDALSKLHEEMQTEINIAREEARRAGFEEGLNQGLKTAQKSNVELISEFEKERQKLKLEQKSAVVDLSVSVVRKIAGKVKPESWLVGQVIRALEDMSDTSGNYQLYVSPVHAENVKLELDKLKDEQNASALVISEVCESDEVDNDTCLLQTPFGSLKLDIDTQLDAIQTLLHGAPAHPLDATS